MRYKLVFEDEMEDYHLIDFREKTHLNLTLGHKSNLDERTNNYLVGLLFAEFSTPNVFFREGNTYLFENFTITLVFRSNGMLSFRHSSGYVLSYEEFEAIISQSRIKGK